MKVLVKILRDSGDLNTFVIESFLAFSPQSSTGNFVPIRLPVQVHLSCDLVQGNVHVGVCLELPVRGFDVMLGSGLARELIRSITSAETSN